MNERIYYKSGDSSKYRRYHFIKNDRRLLKYKVAIGPAIALSLYL